jgi:hypothetical protein
MLVRPGRAGTGRGLDPKTASSSLGLVLTGEVEDEEPFPALAVLGTVMLVVKTPCALARPVAYWVPAPGALSV